MQTLATSSFTGNTALQSVANQQQGWHVVLNSSDIIGIVGTVVGIASIIFGVYQMYEAKRARLDVKKARNLLLRQQVSQHFSGSTTKALALLNAIRAGHWSEGAESASLLFADSATAVGFPETLVGVSNKQNIELASKLTAELIRAISVDKDEVPKVDAAQDLTRNCQTILALVSAVESSLRFSTALGGEEYEQPVTPRTIVAGSSIESRS